ncbi:nucleoside triphosphate pyrophosphohydrolase family protein [Vibrio barjaei]|uniref:nucleoside triphosphate pyrophosphohydrolase family protein n=1 Tax=Vibrio barjaei TaxID=1676683 RepID=UPI00228423B9|nr:nucleoside triphosphate pyrophosphohydrolase family protein [Vibrio barjaei]MCY9872381.1 nucleoside triphosphate pyrophosphohydrolase family protein [Vibrio barjaei]
MEKLYTQEILNKFYQDIVEFRTIFKQPIEAPKDYKRDDEHLHVSLAIEEFTELSMSRSLVDEADALCDMAYVSVGKLVHLGHRKLTDNLSVTYFMELIFQVAAARNIDLLACWDEVHASNISKACINHKQFKETAEHYHAQGVKVEPDSSPQGTIIVKCAADVQLADKFIKKGKVLKSIYYKPAVLDPVPLLKY